MELTIIAVAAVVAIVAVAAVSQRIAVAARAQRALDLMEATLQQIPDLADTESA